MANLIALDYAERRDKLVALYKEGYSLRNIGVRFGISYERVRQIIRKAGVTVDDSGRRKIIAIRAMAKEADRDARYMERFGCTFAEYSRIDKIGAKTVRLGQTLNKPVNAYREHKRNCMNSGIEWDPNFKLYDWWLVWERSGKWAQRGLGAGRYVMRRIADSEPVSKDNVQVVECGKQNDGINRRSFVVKKDTKNGPVWVPYLRHSSGIRCLGSYSSAKAAALAIRIAAMRV